MSLKGARSAHRSPESRAFSRTSFLFPGALHESVLPVTICARQTLKVVIFSLLTASSVSLYEAGWFWHSQRTLRIASRLQKAGPQDERGLRYKILHHTKWFKEFILTLCHWLTTQYKCTRATHLNKSQCGVHFHFYLILMNSNLIRITQYQLVAYYKYFCNELMDWVRIHLASPKLNWPQQVKCS